MDRWRQGTKRGAGQFGKGDRPGPARRVPPPEHTGGEAVFLDKQKQDETSLLVSLRNGETIEGTVEDFDRDMIKLTCDEGSDRFLRKSEIRYICPKDERPSRRGPSGGAPERARRRR